MEYHSTMKGKIVLVRFPYDDSSDSKVRPALCLSDPIGMHRHVVLAHISSQAAADSMETDILIHQNQKEFDKTGLKISSTIHLHQLVTIKTSIIQSELGSLPTYKKRELNKKIKKIFNIN